MKKEISKKLKSEYEKLEIKPSPDLWNRISEIQKIFEPTAKKSFVWWKYAAVFLFLISLGSIFYFNFSQIERNAKVAKSENSVQKNIVKTQFTNHKQEILNRKPIENSAANFNQQKNYKIQENVGIVYEDSFWGNKSVTKDEKTKQNFLIETPEIIKNVNGEKTENIEIAKNKKINYTNAEDLILGREFEKIRQENQNVHKQIGILDGNQIKIKSPNSLKILGITVYSDSLK
jgi:hypothetical protein